MKRDRISAAPLLPILPFPALVPPPIPSHPLPFLDPFCLPPACSLCWLISTGGCSKSVGGPPLTTCSDGLATPYDGLHLWWQESTLRLWNTSYSGMTAPLDWSVNNRTLLTLWTFCSYQKLFGDTEVKCNVVSEIRILPTPNPSPSELSNIRYIIGLKIAP